MQLLMRSYIWAQNNNHDFYWIYSIVEEYLSAMVVIFFQAIEGFGLGVIEAGLGTRYCYKYTGPIDSVSNGHHRIIINK